MKILNFKKESSTSRRFLLCGVKSGPSLQPRKCKQTSKDNTNDHQDGLRIPNSTNNAKLNRPTNQTKTNLEAAKKTGGISIVCRTLWQSVVQTCRQRHACQPVQIAAIFQNHNHNHKIKENQHENSESSSFSRLFLCGVDCGPSLQPCMPPMRACTRSTLPLTPPTVAL